MKSNKGFTLIELLAMITVLGILMAVTIPNITGILNNSRLNVIKSDAQSIIEKAKVKTKSNYKIKNPTENHCIVFTLNYLNDNNDIGKGPNDGIYDPYESFIIYTRVGQRYKYYIKLVEITDDGQFGMNVIDSEEIKKIKENDIVPITSNLGLNNNKEESKIILNANKPKVGYGDLSGTTLCSNGIDDYYS